MLLKFLFTQLVQRGLSCQSLENWCAGLFCCSLCLVDRFLAKHMNAFEAFCGLLLLCAKSSDSVFQKKLLTKYMYGICNFSACLD